MKYYEVIISDGGGEVYRLRFQAEDALHAVEQAEPYMDDEICVPTRLVVEVVDESA